MGATDEWKLSASNAISLAESFEVYAGFKQEISLEANSGLFVGNANETYIGSKQELTLAASLELLAAFKMEFSIAGIVALSKAVKIEHGPGKTELQVEGTAVKKGGATLTQAQIKAVAGSMFIFT